MYSLLLVYMCVNRLCRRHLPQAENTRDPSDIFKFLHANDIGSNLALFYEAWALVLEDKRKTKEADDVFKEGIEKCVRRRGCACILESDRYFVTQLCW